MSLTPTKTFTYWLLLILIVQLCWLRRTPREPSTDDHTLSSPVWVMVSLSGLIVMLAWHCAWSKWKSTWLRHVMDRVLARNVPLHQIFRWCTRRRTALNSECHSDRCRCLWPPLVEDRLPLLVCLTPSLAPNLHLVPAAFLCRLWQQGWKWRDWPSRVVLFLFPSTKLCCADASQGITVPTSSLALAIRSSSLTVSKEMCEWRSGVWGIFALSNSVVRLSRASTRQPAALPSPFSISTSSSVQGDGRLQGLRVCF